MPSFDVQRTLRDYVRILFRRKWLFVIPFVAALFVAGFAFQKAPKAYTSTAIVTRIEPVILRSLGEATLSAGVAQAPSAGEVKGRISHRRELIRILCADTYEINLNKELGIEVGRDVNARLTVGDWDMRKTDVDKTETKETLERQLEALLRKVNDKKDSLDDLGEQVRLVRDEIDRLDKEIDLRKTQTANLLLKWTNINENPRWNRVVQAIKRNISVRVVGSARSASQTIYITYTHSGGWGPRGKEPELAQKVCRGLMDTYIQTSRSRVKKQLEETKETLERQLEVLLRKVETKKKAKDDFEKQYLGKMPKDAAGIDQELKSRRAEAAVLGEQVHLAKGEIARLAEELAKTPTTIVIERAHGRNPRVEQIEKEIRDYRAELRRLRLRFTEEHPRIKELQSLVEAARQEKASLPPDVEEGRREGPNPEWQRLAQQLAERRRELAKLEDRLADSRRAHDSLEKEKTSVLKRYREFVALQEGYTTLNEKAVSLSRRIERNAQDILTHDKEEDVRFEVLGHPLKPLDPTKPDPLVFLLFGLLGGAAAGTGLVVLAEHTDHSLRSVSEARRFLQVPVVGTIGVIRTRTQRRLRLVLRVARLGLVIAVLLGPVAALLLLWQNPWHSRRCGRYWEQVVRFWREPEATIHQWTGGRRVVKPSIQRLDVEKDPRSGELTLIARDVRDLDVSGAVECVEFYRDDATKKGKGRLNVDKDVLLGTDVSSDDGGWRWGPMKVTDWPTGAFTCFARAQNASGLWSDPVKVTGTIP